MSSLVLHFISSKWIPTRHFPPTSWYLICLLLMSVESVVNHVYLTVYRTVYLLFIYSYCLSNALGAGCRSPHITISPGWPTVLHHSLRSVQRVVQPTSGFLLSPLWTLCFEECCPTRPNANVHKWQTSSPESRT